MDGRHTKKSFAGGEIILRQGEQGKCAYIIEEGRVEILIERPGGKIQHLGTRGPGTIIGEMAIVDDAPRVATVLAVEDCRMLEISREDFALRLKSSDPVIQMITQVILTRYRDTLTRTEILGNSLGPAPEALERSFTEQTDVVESIKIANEFKEALHNNGLALYYQPVIDLAQGHVVGFEALMRWPRPDKGPLSPGVFIPIAEKSGLIVAASKWALAESCRALRRIEDSLGKPNSLWMSINFSSQDFEEPDFVENLMDTIRKNNIDPPQIKLEITERLLIQQPDTAKETLEACRDQGVRIAIDDFGTGYSSLSYLYYFPIETLKIDQSFIRAIHEDPRSLELVRSIVGIGKTLNMTVVAEGVETIEEARLLQSMGCDTAQGYYFAKPLPEKDVIALLAAWSPRRISA